MVLVVACSAKPPPEQHGQDAPSSQLRSSQIGASEAPATVSAAEPSAAADAATAAASSSAKAEESAGRGSCVHDDDCVLTSYQPGCCVQACEDYASNKADLAALQAKEDCAATRPERCPPPAPCRRPTHRVLAAKCSAGACVAIREPIAR